MRKSDLTELKQIPDSLSMKHIYISNVIPIVKFDLLVKHLRYDKNIIPSVKIIRNINVLHRLISELPDVLVTRSNVSEIFFTSNCPAIIRKTCLGEFKQTP